MHTEAAAEVEEEAKGGRKLKVVEKIKRKKKERREKVNNTLS